MTDLLPDGTIFGLMDNGILMLGAYTGLDLGERLGNGRGPLGAVLGAMVGNLVSDAAGALTDPTMAGMVLGISLGCLLPFALVPVAEKLRRMAANRKKV